MQRDLEAWWSGAAFRADLGAWVTSELTGHGIGVTGEVVAHRVRFWSAVFRVPTSSGQLWVKAANPGQGFEVDLTLALAGLVPEHVVAPVATLVDPASDRFWMLLPDGGSTLRERGGTSVAHWERLVRDAVDMQRALISHGARLRRAGLVSLGAADGVAYVERLLERGRTLARDDPNHLAAEEAGTLAAGLPLLRRDLELLAASSIPDSLQHNDLTDANAFVSGPDGLGPLRFFDLGDAFWGHPFAALHLTLCVATRCYPWPDLDSEVAGAIVEAYLSGWADHVAVSELRPLVVPALRLALLHRAESWRRLLAAVPPRADPPRIFDSLLPAMSDHGGTMTR